MRPSDEAQEGRLLRLLLLRQRALPAYSGRASLLRAAFDYLISRALLALKRDTLTKSTRAGTEGDPPLSIQTT